MKIGERGQVTIPKQFRDRYGLAPDAEVEFITNPKGELVLRRVTTRNPKLDRWIGYCGKSFKELGFKSVDQYIEAVRGR